MKSTHHKLQRTMSLTDLGTSSAIRDTIERELTVPADRSKHRFFLQAPRHDFILPSLTRFDQDFRKFLLSALVDFGLMQDLEDARCLNWCPVLPKFLPLQTLGDGNCLMHSASLAMWAVQDRRLLLRKSVCQVLIEDQTDMFRKRWQLEQEKHLEEQTGSPVDCSNDQWAEDWKKTIDLASTTKSSETNTFHALEEIHIFTLANIIRRPILVICDDIHRGNYDESLADVNLGGIYLPLLCDSVDCVKSPLVIGYHQGHFMALVTTEDGSKTGEETVGQKNKNAVPLVKYDNSAMQIHFLLPEEQQSSDHLLREYLNCSKVEYTDNEVHRTILVATMQSQEPEPHLDRMFKTYFSALEEVYLAKLMEKQASLSWDSYRTQPMPSPVNPTYGNRAQHYAPPPRDTTPVKSSPCCSTHKRCKTIDCENYTRTQEYCHECRNPQPKLCTSPGCTFAANPNYEGLCSVCFTRFHAILEQGPAAMVTPTAPPSNRCSTSNCQKEVGPHFRGKCHDCYMMYVYGKNLAHGMTKPTEMIPLIKPPGPVRKVSCEKKYGPVPTQGKQAIPRQNSRLFCLNQACNNFLQSPEEIYCEGCLARLLPESRTTAHTATPSTIAMPSTIHEPALPNTIYAVCCVHDCRLPAVTHHNQLCYKHYKESLSHHQGNDVDTHKKATKCITTGCKFFGVPEHNYLCSRCHAKALEDEFDLKEIKAEQERANAEWLAQLAASNSEQYQFGGYHPSRKPFYFEQISTPSRSYSAPPSPNPRRKSVSKMVPCTTKGCPMFGTKDSQGLCKICFEKKEMLLYQDVSRRNRFSSTP